jgi:hypothetical protein
MIRILVPQAAHASHRFDAGPDSGPQALASVKTSLRREKRRGEKSFVGRISEETEALERASF